MLNTGEGYWFTPILLDTFPTRSFARRHGGRRGLFFIGRGGLRCWIELERPSLAGGIDVWSGELHRRRRVAYSAMQLQLLPS